MSHSVVEHAYNPEQDAAFATESDRTERRKSGAPDWYDYGRLVRDDVVADFADALRKLEELIYAVYGAIPDYVNGIPWYRRSNPRCLWPEIKTVAVHYATGPGDGYGEVYDYHQFPGIGLGSGLGAVSDEALGVTVPTRTRSGDPALEYALATHEPEFAPGTVERDYASEPYDAANDGSAEVRWTPGGSVAVVSATLRTSAGDFGMSETAGVWSAAIPAQPQGTVVYWYIDATVTRATGNVAIYEPANPAGGPPVARTPPADPHDREDDAQYTYVSVTHVLGPYAAGFPELITRLGDTESDPPGLRKGTESWRFDSLEDIQPFHINAARFLLDALGRDLQHSPHVRGDEEACCFDMPVHWRWSGGNEHGQYVQGGKTAQGKPLHNLDTDAGSEAARRSWRGIDFLFGARDPFNRGWANYEYGGDESWLTPVAEVWSPDFSGYSPGAIPTEHNGVLYDRGMQAGLQPGDCIDVVHLVEIIEAVDYLLINGCWRKEAIHSAKATPFTAYGDQCGDYYDNEAYESHGCQFQCCALCSSPYVMPDDCTPHAAPDWADCTGNDKCRIFKFRSMDCNDYPPYGDPAGGDTVSTLIGTECEWDSSGPNYVTYDCNIGGGGAQACSINEWVYGWSAYLCGPSRTNNGPDALHGNSLVKHHRGPYPPGDILNAAIPSFGNRYGEVVHCRRDTELPGHPTVGFEEVTAVKWEGLAAGWIGGATCGLGVLMSGNPWPEVPGLGWFLSDGETPICTDLYEDPSGWQSGIECSLSNAEGSNCQGDKCFVSIDLNQQPDGTPRLYDYDMSDPTVWSDCPCRTGPGTGPCE